MSRLLNSGYIQTWFREMGGRQFLENIIEKLDTRSPEKISQHIFKEYEELFSGNSIRNVMKFHNLRTGQHGGNRK